MQYKIEDLTQEYKKAINENTNMNQEIENAEIRESKLRNEFNELKGITDEDDKHYKLLNIDSIKNRYNDIKPCKHYL